MKGISPYLLAGLFFLAIPILLPYMQYDEREFHGLFSLKARNITSTGNILTGMNTTLSYFPLIWTLLVIPSFLRKKSRNTAALLMISSILLLVILAILYFLLIADPSFYRGYVNVVPLSGFWSGLFGALLFLIGSNSTYKGFRNSRRKNKLVKSEVIDDSI